MNRTTLGLVFLLAAGLLALALWPRNAGRESPVAPSPATAPAPDTALTGPAAHPFEQAIRLLDETEQPSDTPAPLTFGSRLVYDDYPSYIHHYDAVLEFALETPFEQLRGAAEAGDGEAAYAMFAYLQFCDMAAPQSEAEAARREEFYIKRLVENPDREEDWWDLASSAGRHLYETCSQFNRADLRRQALGWLVRAADLGYFPAVLAYLESADIHVGTVAIYGHPEVIEDYRARVPLYLSRLLQSRHPDAFATVSYLAEQGLLAPPDPVLAYAYLRAAVLIDIEESRWHNRRLLELEPKLTRPELRQSRELGRELCRRYVPAECGG